ncbi:MAG: hypothetical protein M4579_000461 [Chaenotheca gracillima]|nr:MAG: hypothetical protein M4579_000461 [Chaenotheca gracillima]
MVSPGHTPKRKPLHERSQSQNNESSPSPARNGNGNGYGNTEVARPAPTGPFPTLPSQVLSPTQGLNQRTSENVYNVSETPLNPNAKTSPKNGRTLRRAKSRSPVRRSQPETKTSTPRDTRPNSPRTPSVRASARALAENINNEELVLGLNRLDHTSFRIPPLRVKHSFVSRPSTAASRPQEPTATLNRKPSAVESLGIISSENGSTASFVRRTEATQPELARWLAYADNPSFDKLPRPASPISRNDSRASQYAGRPRRRTSYSAFPPSTQPTRSRRSSSVSAISPLPSEKPSLEPIIDAQSPPRPSNAHRAVSVPVEASTGEPDGSDVRYPSIRAPAASGSWANTSITIPKRVRMDENGLPRTKHRSADLSTVLSVSEPASHSSPREGRSSARSSQPDGSEPSSLVVEPASSHASDVPRRSHHHHRRSSTIRIVSEQEQRDSPGPEPRRWPHARRSSRGGLEPTSSIRRATAPGGSSQVRASSRDSDTAREIPAWARYFHRKTSVEQMAMTETRPETRNANQDASTRAYYARGALPDAAINVVPPSSTDSASRDSPPTSSPTSDRFPQEIFRPRTRPHQIEHGLDEVNDEPTSEPEEEPPLQRNITIRGPPRTRATRIWSPHLRHDKRSSKMSFWEAPQAPEKALYEQALLDRRTLQIALFCTGFIVPFAWMAAALVPLTPPPHYLGKAKQAADPEVAAKLNSTQAVENSQYENARWWRSLNRVMSVIGLFVIGAIITLVIVAIRMRAA